MPNIESYVVLDTQTTGRFWEEFCRTKITKISFISTTKSDIENTASGKNPPHRQLTLLFNPCKPITQGAVKNTGLTNKLLQHEPTFKQKIKTIISFLEELPKPICLIAHNGTSFAFKILLTEFNDAGASLPEDLLCVDSMRIFRKLLNENKTNELIKRTKNDDASSSENQDPDKFVKTKKELLTDDKTSASGCASAKGRKRPKLNKTDKCLEEIEGIHSIKRTKNDDASSSETEDREIDGIDLIDKTDNGRPSFALKSLCKRLLDKDITQIQGSTDRCLLLFECIVAINFNNFVEHVNNFSKLFADKIKPIR